MQKSFFSKSGIILMVKCVGPSQAEFELWLIHLLSVSFSQFPHSNNDNRITFVIRIKLT